LIGYPWHILSAGSVLYLLSLPAGWKSYRDQARSLAAQTATTGAPPSNPAPPFSSTSPPPEPDDRPARLN